MLIPFLYRSTKKRQRSARRGGERREEIWNEEEEGEEVEKGERGKKAKFVPSTKRKKMD